MNQASRRRNYIFLACILVISAVLLLVPNKFAQEATGEVIKVRVLEVDNSEVRQHGIIRVGDQGLLVEILNGSRQGESIEAVNHLFGKLELDKMFVPGDVAQAMLAGTNTVSKVTMQDHYRLNIEIVLLGLYAAMLIAFAGLTGFKALVSFFFTILVIWKLYLPGLLLGWNPILTSLAITGGLCFVIIFLVGGLTGKGLTAFCGSLAGVVFTAVLSLLFGSLFKIHGAVKPFAETLLYSGFGHLDLTAVFLGGIFLASSGAVMDLAMDIAASMEEVKQADPGISRWGLIRAGLNVGRTVVGTMTTTLLLAYTGSYTSLLMVFIAQGVPAVQVLNIQYVASEILHTLVGSFGLLTVAPFTALLGGLILRPARNKASAPVRAQAIQTVNAG